MPSTRLKAFLNERKTKYLSIQHSPAYTAQEVAQSAHVSGREFAKTVIVNVDDRLAMVVLPASETIDVSVVSRAAGGGTVMLASEDEFKNEFPDCEVGAMPPFGNLYGMRVFLSPDLAREKEIAFNAGTHTEVVVMDYQDFEALVDPATVWLP